MRKICLDKTLNLSRGIMNKDVQVPSFIQVTKELGAMDRFNFINSKVELPIEHIGLAVLSYQKAVEQFAFTKISQDDKSGERTEDRQFESLVGTGIHISDFLHSISPDSLNWFNNSNGLLKMEYRNNIVPVYNSSNYTQCKAYSEGGEDIREVAVKEAYMQAMKGYVEEEIVRMGDDVDVNYLEDLHAFVEEDASTFDETMEELKLQSTQLILNPNQNNPLVDAGVVNADNSFAEVAEQ